MEGGRVIYRAEEEKGMRVKGLTALVGSVRTPIWMSEEERRERLRRICSEILNTSLEMAIPRAVCEESWRYARTERLERTLRALVRRSVELVPLIRLCNMEIAVFAVVNSTTSGESVKSAKSMRISLSLAEPTEALRELI